VLSGKAREIVELVRWLLLYAAASITHNVRAKWMYMGILTTLRYSSTPGINAEYDVAGETKKT
jgi:hypothetical protein